MEIAWQQIKERARQFAANGCPLSSGRATMEVVEILRKRAIKAPTEAVEYLTGEMLEEYNRQSRATGGERTRPRDADTDG